MSRHRADVSRDAEPDLRLEGFRLWVHGREYPDEVDYWDANWLNVTARMEAVGSSVEVSGPIVRNVELAGLAADLSKLHSTLTGVAKLECLEPELGTWFEGSGVGQIAVTIEITPDHLNQSHRFHLGTDQTYLPPLIDSLHAILSNWPVRTSPSD